MFRRYGFLCGSFILNQRLVVDWGQPFYREDVHTKAKERLKELQASHWYQRYMILPSQDLERPSNSTSSPPILEEEEQVEEEMNTTTSSSTAEEVVDVRSGGKEARGQEEEMEFYHEPEKVEEKRKGEEKSNLLQTTSMTASEHTPPEVVNGTSEERTRIDEEEEVVHTCDGLASSFDEGMKVEEGEEKEQREVRSDTMMSSSSLSSSAFSLPPPPPPIHLLEVNALVTTFTNMRNVEDLSTILAYMREGLKQPLTPFHYHALLRVLAYRQEKEEAIQLLQVMSEQREGLEDEEKDEDDVETGVEEEHETGELASTDFAARSGSCMAHELPAVVMGNASFTLETYARVMDVLHCMAPEDVLERLLHIIALAQDRFTFPVLEATETKERVASSTSSMTAPSLHPQGSRTRSRWVSHLWWEAVSGSEEWTIAGLSPFSDEGRRAMEDPHRMPGPCPPSSSRGDEIEDHQHDEEEDEEDGVEFVRSETGKGSEGEGGNVGALARDHCRNWYNQPTSRSSSPPLSSLLHHVAHRGTECGVVLPLAALLVGYWMKALRIPLGDWDYFHLLSTFVCHREGYSWVQWCVGSMCCEEEATVWSSTTPATTAHVAGEEKTMTPRGRGVTPLALQQRLTNRRAALQARSRAPPPPSHTTTTTSSSWTRRVKGEREDRRGNVEMTNEEEDVAVEHDDEDRRTTRNGRSNVSPSRGGSRGGGGTGSTPSSSSSSSLSSSGRRMFSHLLRDWDRLLTPLLTSMMTSLEKAGIALHTPVTWYPFINGGGLSWERYVEEVLTQAGKEHDAPAVEEEDENGQTTTSTSSSWVSGVPRREASAVEEEEPCCARTDATPRRTDYRSRVGLGPHRYNPAFLYHGLSLLWMTSRCDTLGIEVLSNVKEKWEEEEKKRRTWKNTKEETQVVLGGGGGGRGVMGGHREDVRFPQVPDRDGKREAEHKREDMEGGVEPACGSLAPHEGHAQTAMTTGEPFQVSLHHLLDVGPLFSHVSRYTVESMRHTYTALLQRVSSDIQQQRQEWTLLEMSQRAAVAALTTGGAVVESSIRMSTTTTPHLTTQSGKPSASSHRFHKMEETNDAISSSSSDGWEWGSLSFADAAASSLPPLLCTSYSVAIPVPLPSPEDVLSAQSFLTPMLSSAAQARAALEKVISMTQSAYSHQPRTIRLLYKQLAEYCVRHPHPNPKFSRTGLAERRKWGAYLEARDIALTLFGSAHQARVCMKHVYYHAYTLPELRSAEMVRNDIEDMVEFFATSSIFPIASSSVAAAITENRSPTRSSHSLQGQQKRKEEDPEASPKEKDEKDDENEATPPHAGVREDTHPYASSSSSSASSSCFARPFLHESRLTREAGDSQLIPQLGALHRYLRRVGRAGMEGEENTQRVRRKEEESPTKEDIKEAAWTEEEEVSAEKEAAFAAFQLFTPGRRTTPPVLQCPTEPVPRYLYDPEVYNPYPHIALRIPVSQLPCKKKDRKRRRAKTTTNTAAASSSSQAEIEENKGQHKNEGGTLKVVTAGQEEGPPEKANRVKSSATIMKKKETRHEEEKEEEEEEEGEDVFAALWNTLMNTTIMGQDLWYLKNTDMYLLLLQCLLHRLDWEAAVDLTLRMLEHTKFTHKMDHAVTRIFKEIGDPAGCLAFKVATRLFDGRIVHDGQVKRTQFHEQQPLRG